MIALMVPGAASAVFDGPLTVMVHSLAERTESKNTRRQGL